MPPREGNKTQTVRDFIRRYPHTPSKTLARMLVAEHPTLWRNIESCRSMIRVVRGNSGSEKQKAGRRDKTLFRPHGKQGVFASLPPSIKYLDPFNAFLVDGPGVWLVIADLHCPFHDDAALTVALEHGKNEGCTGVLINGDLVDFYQISDHKKDPTLVEFREEVEACQQMIVALRQIFPKQRMIWKWGNHEDRYQRWLWVKAPELLGIPEFSFDAVFHLKELKVEQVINKQPIRLGKLWVVHGHEFRSGWSADPVNPARNLFLRCHENAMEGHVHRSSHHGERLPLSNHMISCFSTGCLCQLAAPYNPLNRWNAGFAIVRIEKDGAFTVENYRIVNGKAYT